MPQLLLRKIGLSVFACRREETGDRGVGTRLLWGERVMPKRSMKCECEQGALVRRAVGRPAQSQSLVWSEVFQLGFGHCQSLQNS